METDVQSAVHFDIPRNRRREPREDSPQCVTITNLAQLSTPFTGHIVDSSFSGLKLSLTKPLRRGDSLAVEWDDTCVLGDVVYCIEETAKHLVGIKTNYVILDRTRYHRANESASRRRSH